MDVFPKPYLWVAMDCADCDQVIHRMRDLSPEQCGVKIGMELYTACGPDIIALCQDEGFAVFLDLKWHDIPQTVSRAVSVARNRGVAMVTVHASGGEAMLHAAVEAAAGAVAIIAVTILTSLDAPGLARWEIGPAGADRVRDCVEQWAMRAACAGVSGVVASGHEVAGVKSRVGGLFPGFQAVVPGLRWDPVALHANPDDQKRVVTPQAALQAGADHLVMGRPIWGAPDPRAAIARVHAAMAAYSAASVNNHSLR